MPDPIVEREIEELSTRAELIEKDFAGYAIQNNEGYAFAGEHLKKIKSLSAEIEAKRVSLTKPLNESLKKLNEFFKALAARPIAAEANIKNAMLKFQREQEEIRRKEEARLQEQARKEEERQRKIKEEQERAWREKEEAARKEAERLAAEGKAAEAEKARLEAEKAKSKAEERAEQAASVFVPAPIVESQVQKVNGIKTRTEWKFRIVDPRQIPADFLIPDEKAIGAFIRATKGTRPIRGVEIYSEELMAAGRL